MYRRQKSTYNIDIKIEQRSMKVKSDSAIKKINRLHEIQILYACVNICAVSRDWSEHDESLKIIRQFYPASYLPRRFVEKENSLLSRALSPSHAATLWCIPHTARWIRFIPVSFISVRFFPRRYFEAVDPPP